MPILDDAVTDIYLTNNLHNIISSLDVGLLISDPRVSDLAITLISPNGTRVLLFENRGALTTNGLGIGTFDLSVVTNMAPFYTNNFDLAPVGLYAPGAMFQGWSVLSNLVDVLDDYTCFCLSNHVLALLDGAVSNSLPTTNRDLVAGLEPLHAQLPGQSFALARGDGHLVAAGCGRLGYLRRPQRAAARAMWRSRPAATNLFSDDFDGPGLNPMWQARLPNAGTGAARHPSKPMRALRTTPSARSAPTPSCGSPNTLNPQQRRGWSSATIFNAAGLPLRGALQHPHPGGRDQRRRLPRDSGFWMRPTPTVTTWSLPSAAITAATRRCWRAAVLTTPTTPCRSTSRPIPGIAWC